MLPADVAPMWDRLLYNADILPRADTGSAEKKVFQVSRWPMMRAICHISIHPTPIIGRVARCKLHSNHVVADMTAIKYTDQYRTNVVVKSYRRRPLFS
jgi:hypothetical protein